MITFMQNRHPVRDVSLGRRNTYLSSPHPVRDASLRDAGQRNHFLPSDTFLTECAVTVYLFFIPKKIEPRFLSAGADLQSVSVANPQATLRSPAVMKV
jgi:hypothetical protein